MTRIAGLVLVCALACGPDKDPLDDVITGQTNATGSFPPQDLTTEVAPTTGMFEVPDLGPITDSSAGCDPAASDHAGSGVCDVWEQDCTDGCKCMPYAEGGGNTLSALKCTPVAPNAGGLGEPCTVAGNGYSGFDSCAEGYLCWNVDPETGMGTCFEQCKGAPDNPSCTNPYALCFGDSTGVWYLCLPTCHPLDRPCPGGELCLYNPQDSSMFICAIDASGEEGQAFDPCEYLNSCDPGLFCANPALAAECDQMVSAGCCLPFCDLGAWDCPGVGQECLAWYEEGMAPPMYENVGVCGVPQ